jgi:hypothetical protein
MAEAAKESAEKTTQVNLADLTSDKEAVGQTMEVRHPATGEVLRFDDGRPFIITLVGKDSDRFLELQRNIQDKRIAAMTRTRQPVSAVISDRDDIELLVNATVSWDMVYGDAKASQSSPANFRSAYTKCRWLKRQVDEFVGNTANFFKTP